MTLLARRPLNPSALRAADNAFYDRHPEYVRNGYRIALSECNRRDGRSRAEWMRLYARHGGEVIQSDERRCRPVQRTQTPAPTTSTLAVCATRSGQPVAEVFVEIESRGQPVGGGYTLEDGCIAFEVQPDAYRARAEAPPSDPVTSDSVRVNAGESRTIPILLPPAATPPEMVRRIIARNWQSSSYHNMPGGPFGEPGAGGAGLGALYTPEATHLNAYANVPANYDVVKVVDEMTTHTVATGGMRNSGVHRVVRYTWGPPSPMVRLTVLRRTVTRGTAFPSHEQTTQDYAKKAVWRHTRHPYRHYLGTGN